MVQPYVNLAGSKVIKSRETLEDRVSELLKYYQMLRTNHNEVLGELAKRVTDLETSQETLADCHNQLLAQVKTIQEYIVNQQQIEAEEATIDLLQIHLRDGSIKRFNASGSYVKFGGHVWEPTFGTFPSVPEAVANDSFRLKVSSVEVVPTKDETSEMTQAAIDKYADLAGSNMIVVGTVSDNRLTKKEAVIREGEMGIGGQVRWTEGNKEISYNAVKSLPDSSVIRFIRIVTENGTMVESTLHTIDVISKQEFLDNAQYAVDFLRDYEKSFK